MKICADTIIKMEKAENMEYNIFADIWITQKINEYYNEVEMNREENIAAISTIIKDFRKGELSKPLDYAHVEKWINQFEDEEKDVILSETFQILIRWYYKRNKIEQYVKSFIDELKKEKQLDELCFLCIQEAGYSQKEMVKYVLKIYSEQGLECNIYDGCLEDSPKHYIYIDDGLYTGRRIRTDLLNWIERMPKESTLDVFLILVYSNGYRYSKNKIEDAAKEKDINVRFHYKERLFNDRNNAEQSVDFIWPHDSVRTVPMIKGYEGPLVATGKCNYLYQNSNRRTGIFTSDKAGQIVEYAFLKKGIEILKNISKTSFKPLGLTNTPSFGFGSFCATDLNISNTCPLVLWWGSLEGRDDALGYWYPLLPRRGNTELLHRITEIEEKFSVFSYIDILKTVYSLSIDRYNEVRRSDKDRGTSSVISLSDIRERRDKSNLLQYLNTLDMDAVKMVETVMYIGRDYQIDISEEDLEYEAEMRMDNPEYELPARTLKVTNPDELIFSWLEDLEGVSGWKNKSIEIEQIYQKVPLCKYLERAFEILGI